MVSFRPLPPIVNAFPSNTCRSREVARCPKRALQSLLQPRYQRIWATVVLVPQVQVTRPRSHEQPDARRQLVTARHRLETPRALGRDCVLRLDGDLHVAGLDITLREIRVRIPSKGFRSLELRLWTTLLDPKEAPVQELAQLYAKRWEHELFCRELKHCLRRNDVLQSHPIRVELCQLCAWL